MAPRQTLYEDKGELIKYLMEGVGGGVKGGVSLGKQTGGIYKQDKTTSWSEQDTLS